MNLTLPFANQTTDQKQVAPFEQLEMGKWELDPEPYLDRVYHYLLGEVQNKEGLWTRDYSRQKVMNALGASEFINDLLIFSIHTNFSELDDRAIIEIASRLAENYANKLMDNYDAWEVNPSVSNLESISERLYSSLYVLLMIAKNGGMKKHRERTKPGAYPMPQSNNKEEAII